jgi:hypothetical protein
LTQKFVQSAFCAVAEIHFTRTTADIAVSFRCIAHEAHRLAFYPDRIAIDDAGLVQRRAAHNEG